MGENGFSTGCLYHTNLSLSEKLELYGSVGANAVELSFVDESSLANLNLTPELVNRINQFEYVSVHAPWHTQNHASYNQVGANMLFELRTLTKRLPISGVVFHPDKFEDFSLLEKSGLPVLIENMDKRKKIGLTPNYFAKLKQDFNFGFVLDLQHAYEHDSTMNLAEEMIDAMGDRLKHLHVSGFNSENPNHSLVYCSDNRRAIMDTLAKIKTIPRILEGIITEPIIKTASRELELIR